MFKVEGPRSKVQGLFCVYSRAFAAMATGLPFERETRLENPPEVPPCAMGDSIRGYPPHLLLPLWEHARVRWFLTLISFEHLVMGGENFDED